MAINMQFLNAYYNQKSLPIFRTCLNMQAVKCADMSAPGPSSCSLSASIEDACFSTGTRFICRSQLADHCSTRNGIVLDFARTGRMKDMLNVSCKAQAESTTPVSEAEQEGWKKRQDEAGKESDNGSWQWSLNWNHITSHIIVGSCPRSSEDVDHMVDAAGITAILNLQSDLCFEALKIPFEDIRKRAIERAVYLDRVAIRDFDHGDQGMNLDDAVSMVKSARKVAHPYIDCWVEVRRRLLDGRNEELGGVSKQIYELRRDKATPGNSNSDWEAAQKQVIATTFGRWLEVDLGILQMEFDQLDRHYAAALRKVKADFEKVLGQAQVSGKNSAFNLAKYVADTSTSSSKEVPEEELECDVITRECASTEE
ncbi:hypothetical protein O6H91_09G081700 [Diphasiastrum complanatum]|uniref:Uncharacterized protein n=1 Tax=Diphasiastrum complanatum TaxID=34168 RepID=A0ACC2CRH0_DIPCM|nr:hypothetical protein O6H91_09G081700 [Diphasiastrum complanatum]